MMRILLIILFLISNCNTGKKNIGSKEMGKQEEGLTKIEISGIAYNRKGGAIVDAKSIQYWLDGKESWDEKFLNKAVIVKGYLSVLDDNPVFIDNSEIKSQGIPVSSEIELEKQKKRFWILNPQVKLQE